MSTDTDPRLDALQEEAERRVCDVIAGLLRGRESEVDFLDALAAVMGGVLIAAVTAAAAAAPIGTPVEAAVEDLVDGLREVAKTWGGVADAPAFAAAAADTREEGRADG